MKISKGAQLAQMGRANVVALDKATKTLKAGAEARKREFAAYQAESRRRTLEFLGRVKIERDDGLKVAVCQYVIRCAAGKKKEASKADLHRYFRRFWTPDK